MAQMFNKPGMGGGASAPLPSGGIQGGSRPLQQNAQRMVPNPGQFNGNPRGVYNTNFMGQGNAPSYMQQTNLGRYTPPTMQDGGRYGFNSNQWNNSGGYNYNLPGSYGSPQGGGQFAPMPGQFGQYMQPNQLSGNTFGFGNPFGQGMQQGGMPSRDDIYQQMIRQFGGGSPYQGGRGGGNGAPSYDEWRGGFMTDMMMRSPEESAAREADFRRMYDEQFGGGSPSQGGRMGGTDASGLFPSRSPYGSEEYANYLRQRQPGQYTFSEDEWNQRRQNASNVVTNEPAPGQSGWGGMNSGGPRRDVGTWSTTPDPRSAPNTGNIFQAPGSPMAPDKMGRRPNQVGPAPMPAYDNPANRQYNMNALYQMMGGF